MLQMKLRPEYYKESPGEYAHGECSRKHFSVARNFTVKISNSIFLSNVKIISSLPTDGFH